MQFAGERAQDAVGAGGGFASGQVVVEGDEDSGTGQVGGRGERGGLPAGEGGAAGRQPCVPARVGDGDGDGVERAFGDDGNGAAGKLAACPVQAEQQVAFPVGRGLRAVEVFRDAGAGARAGAADETGDVPCSSRTASITRSRK